MKDLITPIKLIDASNKYSISYSTLREWGKTGRIVVIKRAGVLYADEESIKAYSELQKSLRKHEEYLNRMIAEKEEEVSNIIAIYDDYLFSMRSLEKVIKIFPILISELGELIKNEKTRDIFINIALGEDIYKIARKHSLTYDRTCCIYTQAINIIERRNKLFAKYKNKIVEQAGEIQILKLKINNLKNHIGRLEKTKGFSIKINNIEAISEKSLYLLSLDIKKIFMDDQRVCNCLRSRSIDTVEDLLRFICNRDGDFDSLLEIEGFGKICLKKLKSVLMKNKIIDENGHSDLYEYLM